MDLLEIFRTYFSLRPSPIEITRFFLVFRNGKCTRQTVGINTTSGVPKKIADFLNLPNSSNYTVYCFRTSAALLANAGAQKLRWLEIEYYCRMSSKIFGKEQIISINQADKV
jgi:hypothetical protein